MHSRFVENPLIAPEVTNPSFLRWFCHSHIFKDFCHQVGVEVAFASVYHPQSKRAVERANTLIFSSIKRILKY
jgi:hypothetical protein